jgi:two-component system, LytTR family, sensor kinase
LWDAERLGFIAGRPSCNKLTVVKSRNDTVSFSRDSPHANMSRQGAGLPRWKSAALYTAVWTLLALTFACLSYAIAVSNGMQANVRAIVAQHLLRFYVWATLAPFIFRFASRFQFDARDLRFRRLLLHLPAVVLFSVIHHLLYIVVLFSTGFATGQQASRFSAFYRTTFWGNLYSAILMCALIFIASHALLFYRSYRARETEAAELKAQLAQAQLQALKMQLHPHFLFNTLHSISSLVLEDPKRANQMIARLGDFLRLTLESTEHQVVMLKEEVEFLRCYLEIEQVRFEDRLTVEFDIEPATLSARVPHLILQPIVENAIQHAVALRAAPSRIRVASSKLNGSLHLEVQDDGPGMRADQGTTGKQGLGLKNVRARLARVYGSGYDFQLSNSPDGGLTVSLEMPFEAETPACRSV